MNTRWTIELGNAEALPLPDRSVNLVVGSPPYTDRRTYGQDGISRKTLPWVDWMLNVSREGLRISRGPVVWVINGCMKDHRYQPAVEGLIWEAHKLGLNCEHPLIWSKNAAPNRPNWWSNQWEYIVAFYPDDWDHYFDWQSVATPRVHTKPGGAFRMRGRDGKRSQRTRPLAMHPLARPYDILRATVGGGHMGHKLSHLNEAPYPEKLVEPIIKALTRPGDTVCDPFSGSGTTVSVAYGLGRSGIGYDCRLSQVFLGRRRVRETHGSGNQTTHKVSPTAAAEGPAAHDLASQV